jgi:uncharacterized protein (TIGR03066 family)
MKQAILMILVILTFIACSGKKDANEYDMQEENSNPIVGKWKLHLHQKRENNTKVDLKAQPTEVILNIMDGGYFIIYDTFIDPRFNQKGFNRISERSKGQWELLDDKRLILHHNVDDSTRLEELTITKLNNRTLVTKGKDKKSSIYKTYEGY